MATLSSYQDLRGKVAFVTGGNSGIGAAAAEELARQGANVALVGRSADASKEVEEKINKAGGGKAISLQADVSKPEDVQRALDECVRRFGKLDIVFANAGMNGVWAPLEELKDEEWQQVINVNLSGTFYTIKYAAPMLKKNGHGSIIVCSSINGTRTFSNTGATAYSASKAAQIAVMKMTALELAKHKIRVNAVCPGAIETPINAKTEKRDVEKEKEKVEYPGMEHPIPLTRGKPGDPIQVARLVTFLASDASDLITGTEVFIDGGETLLKA